MIIDNEKKTMVNRLNETLPRAKKIDVAVGYFFISGFAEIMDSLKEIEAEPDHAMRILTSPTTDRLTAETLLVAHEAREDIGRRMGSRESPKKACEEAAKGIKAELEHMRQTGAQKDAVLRLIDMIRRKKIQIRVYAKEQLHAKLYLAKLEDKITGQESIIGSSNFSISGLRTHAELNLATTSDLHYEAFLEWFEDHWNDPSSRPFTDDVAEILEKSWAGREYTPKMVAGKAALTENPEVLPMETEIVLYPFQQEAANAAKKILDDYGGVMIGDVVGTGKSYTGAAVLKHLAEEEILNPLVICPARLIPMWKGIMKKNGMPASNVLSNGKLDRLDDYAYCNAILIDESHAFKDHKSARYERLAEYMGNKMTDVRVIMLTATPISPGVYDLKNQLALFQPDMFEKIPVLDETNAREGRSKLEAYFEGITRDEEARDSNGNMIMIRTRRGEERPKTTQVVTDEGKEKIRELLRHVLIRRTRQSIQGRLEKDDRGPYLVMNGKKNYFPSRRLYNPEYDAEKTYGSRKNFAEIESLIRSMEFARYVPGNYLHDEWRSRPPYDSLSNLVSLGGIVLTSLLKLMESSIMAFDSSIRKYGEGHRWFLEQLEQDRVAVGRGFRDIIRKIIDTADSDDVNAEEELREEMENMESQYDPRAFDMDAWREDVRSDMEKFLRIAKILQGTEVRDFDDLKTKTEDLDRLYIPRDDKLRVLLRLVNERQEKLLIFSESAVTTRYIHRFLKSKQDDGKIDGRNIVQIDSDKDKDAINDAVRRFAPKFNGEDVPAEDQIRILISTDMLSEGLNLQEGRVVINYDFHWNPSRLIQRVGRLDRLGSEHREIEVYNFLTTPLVDDDRKLSLRGRVRERITTIRDIIGTGQGQVLEATEELDRDGVCDIYDGKDTVLEPEVGGGGLLDPLSTGAEDMADGIRRDEKSRRQFEALPYGIRSAVGSDMLLVACAAEDMLTISGRHESTSEFKRYYEVTGKGVKRIRQSSFLRQMMSASSMPQIKSPPSYDKFIAEAWAQFRRDGRNAMRRIPIHKYQRHFDRLLRGIEDPSLRHRVLEARRFVRSRMLQAKHPYRDLIELYREAKRKDLDHVDVLKRLEEIRGKYGGTAFKKTVGRPQILYSMMVDRK